MRQLQTLLAVAGMLGCGPSPSGSALLIEHVNVVDVEAGLIRSDFDVAIDGGRIVAVGPSGAARPPRGATRLDGRGKYLVPGLWDLHVHLWQTGESALPVLVAYGVTGARDMGGEFASLSRWRRRIALDSTVGPRLILSGPRLDGPPAVASVDRLVVTTSEAATRVVDSLVQLGVDFLKVYDGLTREAFAAVAQAARVSGVPFAGHVPNAVSASEASNWGQKSIEHIGFLPPGCLAMFDPSAIAARIAVPPLCRGEGIDTLFARFARTGTRIDPTLVSFEGFVKAADTTAPPDPNLRYIAPSLRQRWQDQWAGFPRWPLATWQAVLAHAELLASSMKRSAVSILVGTDLGNPHVFPGSSLHRELALLVGSGYSPAEVLRAATVDAATFLGLGDSTGTIAPGRAADLVLLDADPLAAITNTERIHAVVWHGQLLGRATLDSLLAAGSAAKP